MTELVISILSDCLSLKGIPSGTATAALTKLITRRHTMLREIILKEVRQGNFQNVDQDDLTSVFFRLIRDAEEGIARNNLLLLARVLNGMAEKNELKAPTFLRYANVLSSLSEDEIVILGIMARHKERIKYIPAINEVGQMDYTDPEQEELQSANPHYFLIQQSLVRTGLVTFSVLDNQKELNNYNATTKATDYLGHHVNIRNKIDYHLTPFAHDLLKYTDFLISKDSEVS